MYLCTYRFLFRTFPAFRERVSGIFKPDDQFVLKVYDPNAINCYYHDDPDRYDYGTMDEFQERVFRYYCNEVECYERINTHNTGKEVYKIKASKLYDYGILSLVVKNSDGKEAFLLGGKFLLMSYIENQPSQICESAIDDGYMQLDALENLGICHQYFDETSFRVNNAQVYFNDFSHARLKDVRVDNNFAVHRFIKAAERMLAKRVEGRASKECTSEANPAHNETGQNF